MLQNSCKCACVSVDNRALSTSIDWERRTARGQCCHNNVEHIVSKQTESNLLPKELGTHWSVRITSPWITCSDFVERKNVKIKYDPAARSSNVENFHTVCRLPVSMTNSVEPLWLTALHVRTSYKFRWRNQKFEKQISVCIFAYSPYTRIIFILVTSTHIYDPFILFSPIIPWNALIHTCTHTAITPPSVRVRLCVINDFNDNTPNSSRKNEMSFICSFFVRFVGVWIFYSSKTERKKRDRETKQKTNSIEYHFFVSFPRIT